MNPNQSLLDSLLNPFENKFKDYEYPKVSIIIPTYNCASSISLTLEHLFMQDYFDYEVIIVDAGSKDRTVEVVQGYRSDEVFVHSVTGFQRYEMLNKGIVHATGQYLNFLFPGDYYLYRDTLKYIMGLALEQEKPALVFCSSLVREPYSEVKVLHRDLSLALLKRGKQPTSLESCWFHRDTFRKIGKFDTHYVSRGGFDFLCRFCLERQMRVASTNRVLLDYDSRVVNREQINIHFKETFRIVFKYFGIWSALRWLLIQRDWIRILKLVWRRIRLAFEH